MKQVANHMIRREVFELSSSNIECQQKASDYVHRLINPQLKICFEELNLGGQHLVIEKLEIDLGSFTADNLEKELVARLRELLEKQLRNYIQVARINRKITTEQGTLTNTVHLLDDAETFYNVLYYFLQHGRLPWWYHTAKQKTVPAELFNIQMFETLKEEEKSSFKELLRSSQAARMRLANQFDTDWIVRFLQYIDIPVAKAVQQWQVLLPVVKAFAVAETVFHQYFWKAWIEAVSGNIPTTTNITLLIEKTARGYNDMAIALANAMHGICMKYSSHDLVWACYAEQIEKYIANKIPYDEFRKQELKELDATTFNVTTGNDLVKEKTNQPRPGKEEEDNALFISAAGLVILHPFLTELFTATGLWQNEQWLDDNSVYRALQMLSQLVFDETGLPEYQLSFLKIVLGIDIDAPLPAQEPLTGEEKQTCTELLQAVIGHWTALRNTSPAALQEGFLQRQGKLVQNKKGYHLTVERLAQDVLLSRLPWGYSMIKLPWMNSMLHVNWL